MDAELKAQVDTLTKEMATLKEANTKLDAEKRALESRVAVIDAAEKEQKWNNVKQHLEVGRVDTPDKVAAERAALEKDPVAFMLTVVNTKQVNAKKEGVDATLDNEDKEVTAYKNAKKKANETYRRSK